MYTILKMSENWIINPKTNRMIKRDSITHRRLINQGVFQRTTLNNEVLHTIQENDNIEELKKQLQRTLPSNQSVRRGIGRNKGRLIKGFKSGRPKKKPLQQPLLSRETSYTDIETATEDDMAELINNYHRFIESDSD